MSRLVRFGISIVVLIVIAVGGWFFNRDSAENANVGDCLHQVSANDAKIVKCGGSDADFSVIGKVGNKKQTEAMTDEKVCEAFADTTNVLWWGEEGKSGDVLCLKSLKA